MLVPLSLDVDGNGEGEYRAAAQRGFDPQSPAMHLDDLLGNRQPESGAALLAGGGVGLLKLVKDLGLVGLRDPGAGVVHRDGKRTIDRSRLDRDFAGISELDSITYEVK